MSAESPVHGAGASTSTADAVKVHRGVDQAPHATRPPRVVMFLANPFEHDTRVYKQARSLIEWGCEVHVIALRKAGLPDEEVVNGIHVHRIPVPAPSLRSLFNLPRSLIARTEDGLLRAIKADLVETPPAEPCVTTASETAPRATLNGSYTPRGVPRTLYTRARGRSRAELIRVRNLARRAWRKVGLQRRLKNLRFRLTPQATRLVRLNVSMLQRARGLAPDVVQSHDLNTLLAGVYSKQLLNVPLVYDSHELYLERNIGTRWRWKDKLLWGLIERACISRCDAVTSVAESICLHLHRQYGIAKPHLIRNVQPFEPPAEKSSLLGDELGIEPDQRILIYPGAITINRGIEALIDAAEHFDHAVCVIMGYAGSPTYLDSLKQRAVARGVLNRRVYFRDAVPVHDVTRYVASADVGVVPTQNVCLSYYYESSNKIFHCMMAGVPLAMSDHAEKRMLVEHWDIGVLFDETDPKDIARVVNNLLGDSARYEKIRRNCLAAARQLNWQHEEHRLRSIFAGLLGDRAPEVPDVSLPPAVAH